LIKIVKENENYIVLISKFLSDVFLLDESLTAEGHRMSTKRHIMY